MSRDSARVRALVDAQREAPAGAVGPVSDLRPLCLAVAQAMPARGAGVSVLTESGTRLMAAASDEVSGRIDELQFTLGEGPCMDAFATRRPVLEPDLEVAGCARWPAYARAASAEGARAVFAFPLQVGAARLGVLDLHRDRSGDLSRAEFSLGVTFAQVATALLLDSQESAVNGRAAAGLDEHLGGHTVLHQAQGMVMVQLGVTLVEALALLRAYAYSRDRDLGEVGRLIVHDGLRLDEARETLG